MRRLISVAIAFLLLAPAAFAASHAELPKLHAVHVWGEEPLYPADYQHWNYVNPDAPRTGSIVLAAQGSFNTVTYGLNGKGDPAPGTPNSASMQYNSLLTSNLDEIDTYYGELAEWIQLPEDRSFVRFKIWDDARWPNGTPVTPQDVIFTWEKQREEGGETFASAYKEVIAIEDLGDNVVQFTFDPESDSRAKFVQVGAEDIIPKYYWEDRPLGETTMENVPGSGPYEISDIKPGNFIEFTLRDDYWGKDKPFNRGLNNYRVVRYDMYRDAVPMRLAIKAGAIDYRAESQAKAWALDYEGLESIEKGVLHKDRFEDPTIMGASGAVFNLKLDKFKDRRVRQAIALAFNFEWTNDTIFYGQYERINSHFQRSFLQATGKPEGLELEILESFRGRVPDEVFGEPWSYPETDGTLGGVRPSLAIANRLLTEAGYVREGTKLMKDGKQLSIDFINRSVDFERILLPWVENLQRLGIDAQLRTLDSTQYWEKLLEKDFEMFMYAFTYGYSPGIAILNIWSPLLADQRASINIHGLKSDVMQEFADMMVAERDRERLNAMARALDRVLTHEHYMALSWGLAADRVLYWDKFGIPENRPKFSSGALATWWIDPDKEATLEARKAEVALEMPEEEDSQ